MQRYQNGHRISQHGFLFPRFFSQFARLVGVANCNHNWFGLQTARFFDRINCDYQGVKTELIANETTLIANKVSAEGTDNFSC